MVSSTVPQLSSLYVQVRISIKALLLVLAFLSVNSIQGQIWTITSCSSPLGTNTYGPMHSVATANATSRTAVIYPSSQLVGISGQTLTAIYYDRITASGSMAGTPNFKVYLKEVALTDWGAADLDWATEIASATLVFNGDPASIVGSSSGWKLFPMSPTFAYSGAQNLAILTEYTNATASTAITWSYEYTAPCINTGNNNTTKYSNNTTGMLPATLPSENYRRPLIGFDPILSCYPPSALTVTNIGATTADISWTAPGTPPSNGYEWEIRSSGLPGSGPAGLEASGSTGAGIVMDVATGLPSATDLNLYVRGYCGGVDYSPWAGPEDFTTLCVAYTPPYIQDFASYGGAAPVGLPCWAEYDNGSPPGPPNTPGTSSWVADGFGNNGTTGAAKINLFLASKKDWLVSPLIDLTGGPFQMKTDFALCIYNTMNQGVFGSDDEVKVLISTDGGATWSTLETFNTGNTPPNTGVTRIYDLTPYSNMTAQFAFWGNEGTVDDVEDVDFFVDNFVVEIPPSCPPPGSLTATAITLNGATLGWTEFGSATVWDLEIIPAASSPTGIPTHPNINTNPFVWSGGSPGTAYKFYVRADCGGSESTWAGPLTFNTLPGNDDCSDAIAFPAIPTDGTCATLMDQSTAGATQSMTACIGSGADDDVWYSFVASSTTHRIELTNVSGLTDLVHQVFSGTCGNLMSLTCSDPNTSTTSGLTIGETYYVRVHTYATSGSAVFNICIKNLPMTFVSSTTTQSSTATVVPGAVDQQIIRVQVIVNGLSPELSLTQLDLNTNGSTNASDDLLAARVYYTGSSTTFSTANQFGSDVLGPDGPFSVVGSQVLTGGTSNTSNYFWVVYDISCVAPTGNVVDAEAVSVTVGGMSFMPTVTAPTGSRPVAGTELTTTQPSTAAVTAGTPNVQVLRFNLTGVPGGSCSTTTLMDVNFDLTGVTDLADIDAVKVYVTTTTTFSTAVQFGATMAPTFNMFFSDVLDMAAGNNYIWVVFDLSCSATGGNLLDANGILLNLNTGAMFPVPTNPTGTRTISTTAAVTAQPSTATIAAGSGNVQVLRINLTNIPQSSCAVELNAVDLDLSGVTDLADIVWVKIYYTTSSTFAATTQFGSNTAPMTSMTITGSQPLAGGSGNYIHIVFDLACTATAGNMLDAGSSAVHLINGTLVPATPNPTGTRTITAAGTFTAATTQPSTAVVLQGSIDNQVLRVQTTACVGSEVTSLEFNTTGSTDPATDISAARAYFTLGTTFSNAEQFGSDVANPNGAFSVTGSKILSVGTGYFWLVYDIEGSATPGNLVDASCTNTVIDGGSVVPGTPNPTGTRTIAVPVANDNASGAIALTLNAACSGNPYTNVNSSLNLNEPYPSCSGVAGTPVWFSFVAPASGAVRVTLDILPIGTFTDSKVAIFSASDPNNYNTFSIIACDDDGGSAAGSGFLSVVFATGLTGGTTYYIAVDKYTPTTTAGTFCIQVDELSSAMLSTTNNCGSSYQTPVNNGVLDYPGWLPLLDASSRLVALVKNPAGGNPNLYTTAQNVHTGAVRQDGAGRKYLDRNFLINNSTATNVMVQLFFTNAEFNDLQTADPAIIGLGDLNVTRTSGACATDFVPTSPMFLMQTSNGQTSSVSWVEFNTPSFSNFFIHGGPVALPIQLVSFQGKAMKDYNLLTWETASELNADRFEIYRASSQQGTYQAIGSVPALNLSNQSYSFEDLHPHSVGYYKLKMMDMDGQYMYSEPIVVRRAVSRFSVLNVYPVPATDVLYVDILSPEKMETEIIITDITGKKIHTSKHEILSGEQTLHLSLENLQPGTYFLSILDHVSKVMKY